MAEVVFKNVKKQYDNGFVAVKNFSLDIKDKEFVVFVGPSGCGKSTTLRMLAGLEEISGGEILIDGAVVNNVESKNRDISMVFQNYALFPHLTVFDNIAFPLKMRKYPKAVIKEKVEEAAAILEISDLLDRKPKALSGGQRQRVAIGRSIVRKPKVYLMDEPLSNLDAKLRSQMRAEILKLRIRMDTTFIYVTHDQTEAMTLGDRIVIMNKGEIMQADSPIEVYNHPANLFVAGFIGTPQMNFIPGELSISDDGSYCLMCHGTEFKMSSALTEKLTARGTAPQSVTAGIRPENLDIADTGLRVRVMFSEILGGSVNIHTEYEGEEIIVHVDQSPEDFDVPENGSFICIRPSGRIHLFSPETGLNLAEEK